MIITTEGERGIKNHLHIGKKSVLNNLNVIQVKQIFQAMVKSNGMENVEISTTYYTFKIHKRKVGKRSHYYIDEEKDGFYGYETN